MSVAAFQPSSTLPSLHQSSACSTPRARSTGTFEPGKDPEDEQAVQDWKDGGKAGPRPQIRTLDGRVSFTMGQYSSDKDCLCALGPWAKRLAPMLGRGRKVLPGEEAN